ncbi:MAG: aldose 1-epimerase [Flavobacteriaceae bacterium]|nr:aldose 1-epimerase [Flavobacteriaceae bacterium]
MVNLIQLTSFDKNTVIKIDKGELVSFINNNKEIIHQKESVGWDRSEIEMFPIIGPTFKNSNKVSTLKGYCIQDQHGFLRELKYDLLENSKTKAVFQKIYKANTKIKNSRFPDKSNEEFIFWTYSFTFKKTFELDNNFLKIIFEIISDKGMPFMFGFHPAFKLSGNLDETIQVKNKRITIEDIIQKGSAAYPFFDVNEITLIKKEGQNIRIKIKGFDNIMFWTEANNMVCLEPITQYPNLETQNYSEKNMRISRGEEMFSVVITLLKDNVNKKLLTM